MYVQFVNTYEIFFQRPLLSTMILLINNMLSENKIHNSHRRLYSNDGSEGHTDVAIRDGLLRAHGLADSCGCSHASSSRQQAALEICWQRDILLE